MLSGDRPATGRPDDDQLRLPHCLPARHPMGDDAGWKQIMVSAGGRTWTDNLSTTHHGASPRLTSDDRVNQTTSRLQPSNAGSRFQGVNRKFSRQGMEFQSLV